MRDMRGDVREMRAELRGVFEGAQVGRTMSVCCSSRDGVVGGVKHGSAVVRRARRV